MIEVSHLTKRYGDHTAVSDLSFHIEKGQIYGFLGPNGAGKSTTMNMMTGCLAVTSGEIRIGGYDIFEQPDRAKRLIGYLPEQPPLYHDRTPREYLTFVGRAKHIPASQLKEQVEQVMEQTGLTDVADRLIHALSKGYKQRVGIAQAILGDPEVIILDEPTVGLDPRQIIEIRDLIRELGSSHTVILSSHILSEVQAVCSTILIISKGKLVACDTPEQLEAHFAGTASVELTAETDETEARTLLEPLGFITGITVLQSEPERVQLRVDTDSPESDDVCRALFFAFSEAGIPLLQLTTQKTSLEDVFIELTAESNEEETALAVAPAAQSEETEVETE